MTEQSSPIPRCGIRYFECAECAHQWHEATRDCFSPSKESCPQCFDMSDPIDQEHHPEWPLDGFNLKADVDYLRDYVRDYVR